MERVKEFDGIRGLAALSVVLFHLSDKASYQLANPNWLFPFTFPLGARGVETFFMLSGFVIFLSLERQSSIIKFFRSRFIRLFPIFWVCVIFSTLLILIFRLNIKISPTILLANLTMIPRQFVGVSSNIEGSYWTLECELWFYLTIALIYFKVGEKYVIYTYIFLASLGVIAYYFDITHHLDKYPWIFRVLFMRLYGILNIQAAHLFLAGISLYLHRKTQQTIYCLIFIFATLCSLYINGFVVVLISGILWFSQLPLLKLIFCNRLLLFLGEISYPAYLIHMNLGKLIVTTVSNFSHSTSFGLLAGVTGVAAVSTFLTFQVDLPLRKYLQQSLR